MKLVDHADLSIVIPSYNVQQFIEEAIHSALNQSLKPKEIIVVNDGSTDATLQIASRLRHEPLLRILDQSNRGLAAARNAGLHASSTRWIAFIDADDRWSPDGVEKHMRAIASLGDVAFQGALMSYSSLDGSRSLGIRGTIIGANDVARVRSGNLLPCAVSSIVFDREILVRLGGFDETFPVAEDLELISRLALLYDFRILAQTVGTYALNPESMSVAQFAQVRLRARYVKFLRTRNLTSSEMTFHHFRQELQVTPAALREDFAAAAFRLAGALILNGRYVAGLRALAGGLRDSPLHFLRLAWNHLIKVASARGKGI